MFRKLLLIVIVIGATACALLVNRQWRIETAHSAAMLHAELARQRAEVWELRSRIAARSRPDQVREAMAGEADGWSPILEVSP